MIFFYLLGNIETEISISTGASDNSLNERRSVHFFDLQSNITESEFLDDISEINNIIKRSQEPKNFILIII